MKNKLHFQLHFHQSRSTYVVYAKALAEQKTYKKWKPKELNALNKQSLTEIYHARSNANKAGSNCFQLYQGHKVLYTFLVNSSFPEVKTSQKLFDSQYWHPINSSLGACPLNRQRSSTLLTSAVLFRQLKLLCWVRKAHISISHVQTCTKGVGGARFIFSCHHATMSTSFRAHIAHVPKDEFKRFASREGSISTL